MEEHPELSPAEATKRAMRRSSLRSSRSRWCCCRCSCRSRSSRAFPASCSASSRSPSRSSMFLSAINALTLSPALVRRAAAAASWAPAGADRHGDARHRPGARRLWRRRRAAACGSRSSVWRWSRSRAPASSAWPRVTPTGFLPEDDQGAFFVVIQTARRRLDRAHVRRGAPGRGDSARGRGGRRFHLGHRTELHRQLFAAECRLHGRHAEAVRGAQGPLARGAGADRAARHQVPPDPAAEPRSRWRRRRSSAWAPAAASPMCCRICAAADPQALAQVAARADRRGQPGSAVEARVQHVLGHEPVDLPRYRSRQGAGPRRAAEQRLPGACRRRWAGTTSTT